MDEYDNISQMPRREQPADALPHINFRALSLLDEHGHLTITFWLLAAVIVVGIYLLIEMLSEEEAVITPVPDVAQAGQNHATPAQRKRTPTKSEAESNG